MHTILILKPKFYIGETVKKISYSWSSDDSMKRRTITDFIGIVREIILRGPKYNYWYKVERPLTKEIVEIMEWSLRHYPKEKMEDRYEIRQIVSKAFRK